MSRSKSHKHQEDLLGELRSLRAENKRLKQQLNQAQKQFYAKIERIEEEKPKEIICPECGKGHLRIFELVGRQFVECDLCFYRERLA